MKVNERTVHPTQKPVQLISTLIQWITNPGDLVLDPFCGSETTAIACKELNRNYICIEKEKEYFDIACKRVNQPRETVENDTILENFNQENIPEFKQLSLF
jgi:site-specific DNA-methyltransferase (adenine-specific)